VASTINQGVVAHGSVLARIEFARPTHPGTASITLTPVFAFEQVFRYVDQDAAENWLVVGDALNEIGPDVVEAVEYVRARAPHQQSPEQGYPAQPAVLRRRWSVRLVVVAGGGV
jgi:hypothetical protein